MTDDQQRITIAIAEFCGWQWVNQKEWCWQRGGEKALRLPDYTGSLDAMSDARKRLPASLRPVYISRLADVLIEDGNKSITTYDYADATAAQHAEAFLRTIAKTNQNQP